MCHATAVVRNLDTTKYEFVRAFFQAMKVKTVTNSKRELWSCFGQCTDGCGSFSFQSGCLTPGIAVALSAITSVMKLLKVCFAVRKPSGSGRALAVRYISAQRNSYVQ